MKASAATYKDVHKYFYDTYIIVPEVSPETWYRVRSVDASGMRLVSLDGETEGFISFEDGGEYTIQSPLFNKNLWVNIPDNKPVFITRIPARQWQKGLSSGNTAFYTLVKALSKISISPDAMKAALKSSYPEVVHEVPVALSPYWALSKENHLYYKDCLVGLLDRKKKTLFVPRELAMLSFPPQLSPFKVCHV